MRGVLIPLALALSACSGGEDVSEPVQAATDQALVQRVTEIERASGGRLGVALHGMDGGALFQHRGAERFAMCSTFKFALAAMVLEEEGLRDKRLSFGSDDLLDYAPYARERASTGWMSTQEAAHHAVTLSDNTAANLLLREVGGPEGFTRWIESFGDSATRLDRTEPALNENAPGDLRDTTTPQAHARLVADILSSDRLAPEDRALLNDWLVETSTGTSRLRAGLPADWVAGDKTGSCGASGGKAINDIAVFRMPDGRKFVLASYLDGAKGTAAQAEKSHADVARAVSAWLSQTGA